MNEWKFGRWGWEKIREERRKCGRCRRGGKGGWKGSGLMGMYVDWGVDGDGDGNEE